MIEHQQIFPTNLFLIDHFIPMSTESERSVLYNMKNYINDLWQKRDYDNNWQTKSADLHKNKEFEHFTNLVLKTGQDICNTLGYDVNDLIMVTDIPGNFELIEEIIRTLDKENPQINISVKFIENKAN